MTQKIITIIGGTGFLGRYVVKALASSGYAVRVVSRHPQHAIDLKTAGDVGQITLMYGNIARPDSLKPVLDGAWAVINLVGILFEGGGQNFSDIHAKGAEKLAQFAKAAGVSRFVHLSSLGVDKAVQSKYARTKITGEKAVTAAFPEATILRPGLVFGAEDNFFNMFATLAAFSPVLPLIGGGKSLFQPVYVGDVAKAVAYVVEHVECTSKIYELGGPKRYSFKALLQYICTLTHRKRILLPIPFSIAGILGYITQLFPHPLLTHDQVALLAVDNVVSGELPGFADLHIVPQPLEVIVPKYLVR